MELDVVAIIPRIWRGHNFFERRILDFSDAHQLVPQDRLFEFQLLGVRQGLVMAAAADAEMLAPGRSALRRGFDDFNQRGASEAAFLVHQTRTYGFAWQGKRTEDGTAVVQASHAFTAVDGCGQRNFNLGLSHAASFPTPAGGKFVLAGQAKHELDDWANSQRKRECAN